MKICYFVTVSNEYDEMKKLLTLLSKEVDFYKHDLVILMDRDTVTLAVKDLVDEFKLMFDYQDPSHNITIGSHSLSNDFSKHKNWILNKTEADYILQIDADELPSADLLKYLPLVLESNPDVDAWAVERHNYVIGINDYYLKLWDWGQDQMGRINFPDAQTRLFKNSSTIKWINSVHERLSGYQRIEILPSKMYLEHIKTIDKQIAQNQKYSLM